MKIIVGLGNPGVRFEKTRHNAGATTLDALFTLLKSDGNPLQEDWKKSKGSLSYFWFDVDGEKVELVRPQTFMNDSGLVFAYIKKKHSDLDLDNLFVIHDDLDIGLGDFKIQKGKGPKDHNGLASIYEKLGSKDFWHVRVGIENRKVGRKVLGEEYVLQPFSDEEGEVLRKTIKKIVEEVVGKLHE